eukprot:531365-Pelagomonas_calceolata.AAC.1
MGSPAAWHAHKPMWSAGAHPLQAATDSDSGTKDMGSCLASSAGCSPSLLLQLPTSLLSLACCARCTGHTC